MLSGAGILEANSHADYHLRTAVLPSQIVIFHDDAGLGALSHVVPLPRMPFLQFPDWCSLLLL